MQISLRQTLLFSLALALIAILAVQTLIRYQVVLPKLAAQSQVIDKKDLERVKSSTDSVFVALSDMVFDNAVWEEMTERMAAADVEFLEYTYNDPDYFEHLNLNGIYFYDRDGNLVWGLGLDEAGETMAVPALERPAPEMREALLVSLREMEAGAFKPINKQGLTYLNQHPAMFASVSIALPNRPETYQGTLTFFRFLDERQLAELATSVRQPLAAKRLDGGAPVPPGAVEAEAVYDKDTDILRHDGRLTLLYRDIHNAPFMALSFPAHPVVYDDALLSLSLLAELSTAVLALLLFYLYLDRSTIRPIQHLSRIVQRVTSTGDYRAATQLKANNELGVLSQRLDRMLATIASQQQELTTHNLKLQALSDTDQLTGLANRRYLQSTIYRMEASSHSAKTPISVLVIDIDNFKQYNDQYGHSAGDRTLSEVAEVLRGYTHEAKDLLARYGGEEFVLLLTDTDADGARAVADNLLAGVRTKAIPHCRSGVADCLTVSIGIATKPAGLQLDYLALFDLADDALYQAKQNGRNRAVVAATATQDLLAH